MGVTLVYVLDKSKVRLAVQDSGSYFLESSGTGTATMWPLSLINQNCLIVVGPCYMRANSSKKLNLLVWLSRG